MALSPPNDRNMKLSPLWPRTRARSISESARISSGRRRPITRLFDPDREDLKVCQAECRLLQDQVHNLDHRIRGADEYLKELQREARVNAISLPECLFKKEEIEQRLATLKMEKDAVAKLYCDLKEDQTFQKELVKDDESSRFDVILPD